MIYSSGKTAELLDNWSTKDCNLPQTYTNTAAASPSVTRGAEDGLLTVVCFVQRVEGAEGGELDPI